MSADREKAGLFAGLPQPIHEGLLLVRHCCFLGWRLTPPPFHIGLNLLILFHLCLVQVNGFERVQVL